MAMTHRQLPTPGQGNRLVLYQERRNRVLDQMWKTLATASLLPIEGKDTWAPWRCEALTHPSPLLLREHGFTRTPYVLRKTTCISHVETLLMVEHTLKVALMC